MVEYRLVIGLIVLQGCTPNIERDDLEGRRYTGAEWQLDDEGNVVGVRAVLVERTDGGFGRIVTAGVASDVATSSVEALVPLTGTFRGGVLRVVEKRASGKRVLDLTPVSDCEFDERMRARDTN